MFCTLLMRPAGHLGFEFTASTEGRPQAGSGNLWAGSDRGAVRPFRDLSRRVAEAAGSHLFLHGTVDRGSGDLHQQTGARRVQALTCTYLVEP